MTVERLSRAGGRVVEQKTSVVDVEIVSVGLSSVRDVTRRDELRNYFRSLQYTTLLTSPASTFSCLEYSFLQDAQRMKKNET